jgi:hypothetical protein
MTTQTITTEHATSSQPGQPRTATTFRKIKLLTAGYLGAGVLAVATTALMGNQPVAVWAQGIVVAASAVGALVAAVRMARGSRGAYRRLRILSVVVVAAIAVKIALPAVFPLWLKAELGVAGLLMLGVAVLANGSHVRSLFAAK